MSLINIIGALMLLSALGLILLGAHLLLMMMILERDYDYAFLLAVGLLGVDGGLLLYAPI